MLIIVFDPGDSTGWVCAEVDKDKKILLLSGGTIKKSFMELNFLVSRAMNYSGGTVAIVYETFQLYPGRAAAMSWNTFYPVEVIGVIKYLFDDFYICGQQPSVKKYSGGLDARWEKLRDDYEVTEHTKDAYLHLKYFLRSLECTQRLQSDVQ